MGNAVIVSTARTPIGTAYKGSLVDLDAFALGTDAVREAVVRSGIEPARFDDVILGESLYGGGDIARYAAIEAGMEHVPGLAQNRTAHRASPRSSPRRRRSAPTWIGSSWPAEPSRRRRCRRRSDGSPAPTR